MLARSVRLFMICHSIIVTAHYPCGNGLKKHKNFYLVDQDSVCGKGSTRQAKIMNGQNVTQGEFPWVAHITKEQTLENGTTQSSTCTGSLINKRYIVSAAHCFIPPRHNIKVVLNLKHKKDLEKNCGAACGYQVYDVERVDPHKGYSDTTHFNDIALVRLARDVHINEETKPVCLPVDCDLVNLKVKEATAVGWGNIKEAPIRKEAMLLKKVKMSETPCKKPQPADTTPKDSKVCMTRYDRRGPEVCVCKGDSGGPLMVNSQGKWVLGGISSSATRCDPSKPDRSSTFTKMAAFMPWLLDNIAP